MRKMESKAIKISSDNYRWLLNLAADLQKRKGSPVSFDETLNEIRKESEEDIMDLAGSWKMSDKETEKLLDEIYSERKVVSRRMK